MPRIEVNPTTVQTAAGQVKQAGATTREAVGYLRAGNISEPGLSTTEAVASFCSSWSTGLTAFAQACDSLSSLLYKTATEYSVTEHHLAEDF